VAPDPKNTLRSVQYQAEARRIERNWDLFSLNHAAIKADFELLTAGRESQPVPKGVTVIGDGDVFLEEGASVLPGMLNTTEGPIYLGRNSQVMEACAIRGPFALCEGAIVKMGAKIYTGTTIGPYSKVGGEVNNSILMGYSNKGHDGFLGNSVLGEWCNLGADTNTSNMKNNYTEIRLWDYADGRFSPTGLQFCGLMMGDHSKTGINTMLNTGTVIGVSCNVFGSGYPRNFIPSFSWGSGSGMSVYKTAKAFETAEAMMKRRGVEFDEADKAILEYVFEASSSLRRY
jgi:UDP-N-acetylglucosamine diphosphorylase/glucosamine-1-phosphate N-acetyltransferase